MNLFNKYDVASAALMAALNAAEKEQLDRICSLPKNLGNRDEEAERYIIMAKESDVALARLRQLNKEYAMLCYDEAVRLRELLEGMDRKELDQESQR